MKRAFERFYASFGDRGIMFIMFAVSVVFHAILTMDMELPAVSPDEFGVASIAAFYSGHDWSGLMSQIGYYYGYVQAILYAPLFTLFRNPYALYKAMLVMNGVIVSLIPLIAYNIASKLGIERVWQKIIISGCCGLYITYVAHSKFIWNEAICSLMPWLLIWCVLQAWQRQTPASRFSMSVLTGFMCAVAYAAHSRLIAVVIALVLTVVIARVFFKEKTLNLSAFFLTLIVSFAVESLAKNIIQTEVWKGNASGNTLDEELSRLGGLFESGGLSRLFSVIFGHIYTFFTSTVGIGALALAVFAVLIYQWIKEGIKNKETVLEDGTRVYEPVKHKYGLRLTVFAIYAFLAVGGSMLLSALFKFNSDKISTIADLTIFGRYTDNTAPLAVFLVIAYMFLYGINLKNVLSGAGIYAYSCLCFGICAYPFVKDAVSYRESPILGLLPWRIGEDCTEPLTGQSFVIMSSCVFVLFALMTVVTACSRKNAVKAISVMMCGVFIYTTAFAAAVYLPMRAEENAEKSAPAVAVSDKLYNDPQSPLIVVYQGSSRLAGLIQFLNPEIKVTIIRKAQNVPESCLLIAENGVQAPFEGGSYDVVAKTDDYTIYAYGEAARDFIRYKEGSSQAAVG